MKLRKLIERCETFFPSRYIHGVAENKKYASYLISLLLLGLYGRPKNIINLGQTDDKFLYRLI